jgi:hypothetical protein
MEPLWLAFGYQVGRARQRIRAALDGQPESGALTLEWLVIAGILVAAAIAAGAFLTIKIKQWEAKVP